MSASYKLKIIEIRDGHLPAGISGKDITGPIVLMEDGKLPEGMTEQHLAEMGATVLSIKSSDKLPYFLPESHKQQYLQMGVSEEKLNEMGFVIIDDAVVAAGSAEVERMLKGQLPKSLESSSTHEIEQQLVEVKKRIDNLGEELARLEKAWSVSTDNVYATREKTEKVKKRIRDLREELARLTWTQEGLAQLLAKGKDNFPEPSPEDWQGGTKP